MKIRSAVSADIEAIARVHIAAFPGFFLSRLGFGFLCELYRGFLNHPEGVLMVAEGDAGQLIGFVAGTTAPNRFFADLRRARAMYFVLHAVPALIRSPSLVVAKLYSALFYRGDKPANLERGALLSSIGVTPGVVGKAVGMVLLNSFEKKAFARGASFFYLTTDAIDNDRVNHFYTRNGYVVESQFMQGGKRPMLRYMKIAASAAGV